MIKYIFSFSLIVMLVFIFSACNKAVNPTTFSFTLNGSDVVVDSSYAQVYTYTSGSVSRRQIQILAYSGGKQVLEILALPKIGSQPVLTNSFITYFNNGGYNSSDVFYADAGGVNFTTCDTAENIIQGTFSAENMINSDSLVRNISNGKIYIDKIIKF